MTEIEIYGTGKRVSIPSCWDEMSSGQVQFVFRLYDRCIRRQISPLEFNVRVLYHFLGLKRSVGEMVRERVFPERARRKAENVYRLCEEALGFLFAPADVSKGRLCLSFDALANPMPVARRGLRRPLVGPADMLSDLTFGEFRHAAVCLDSFFRTGSPRLLDECIAHLYRVRVRSANRAGRRVAPVSARSVGMDTRRTASLAPWQKSLVMMWFSACLKYLQSGVAAIDGELVEMSRLFSGDGSGDKGCSWNDLLIEISKEQTIGNMERVDEEPLFSIFSIMWHNHKERKRYEKIAKAR